MVTSGKKAAELNEAEIWHQTHTVAMATHAVCTIGVCSPESEQIQQWLKDRTFKLGFGLQHYCRVNHASDCPAGIVGFSVDFFRRKIFQASQPDRLPGELEAPQICLVKLDRLNGIRERQTSAVFSPVPDGQRVVVTNLTEDNKYFGMRMGIDQEDFPSVVTPLKAGAQIQLTASQRLRLLLSVVPDAALQVRYGSWGAFVRQAFDAASQPNQ